MHTAYSRVRESVSRLNQVTKGKLGFLIEGEGEKLQRVWEQ